MCNEAVDAYTLKSFPDDFMTQQICNKAMGENPAAFFHNRDCFKTQKMCIKALEVDPWQLGDVTDYFKTPKICDGVMWKTFILYGLSQTGF